MTVLESKKSNSSFKRKSSTTNSGTCKSRSSTQLNLDEFKETTFIDPDTTDLTKITSSVDMLPNQSQTNLYGQDQYNPYGLEGDDDSSMRSDHHQLLQQAAQIDTKYFQQARGPPSYFDLEQSVVTASLNDPSGGRGTFVNIISPSGEAKPDLIQNATIYSNQAAELADKNQTAAIFDTISFESDMTGSGPNGGPTSATSTTGSVPAGYEINQMPAMIAVASDQLSGK